MGRKNSNKRVKRTCPSLFPIRRNPLRAPVLRGLGRRLGAGTSISAGLLALSVAGAATPVALAETGPPPAPAPAAEPHAPKVLGLPGSWTGTARAPAVLLPLRPPPAQQPAPAPAPPPPAPAGDQLNQWITQAVDVMRHNGVPVSPNDIPGIRTVIEKESGGDPQAVNDWDSNAAAGHPSKGLMQCIDSTFQANKLAGHDDIFNPVDNIIAAVRYTIDRYGGWDNHPGLRSLDQGGSYRGY